MLREKINSLSHAVFTLHVRVTITEIKTLSTFSSSLTYPTQRQITQLIGLYIFINFSHIIRLFELIGIKKRYSFTACSPLFVHELNSLLWEHHLHRKQAKHKSVTWERINLSLLAGMCWPPCHEKTILYLFLPLRPSNVHHLPSYPTTKHLITNILNLKCTSWSLRAVMKTLLPRVTYLSTTSLNPFLWEQRVAGLFINFFLFLWAASFVVRKKNRYFPTSKICLPYLVYISIVVDALIRPTTSHHKKTYHSFRCFA